MSSKDKRHKAATRQVGSFIPSFLRSREKANPNFSLLLFALILTDGGVKVVGFAISAAGIIGLVTSSAIVPCQAKAYAAVGAKQSQDKYLQRVVL